MTIQKCLINGVLTFICKANRFISIPLLFLLFFQSACRQAITSVFLPPETFERAKTTKNVSCNPSSFYIPDSSYPKEFPIQYIRVNAHIMHADSSMKTNLNFQEAVVYVNRVLEIANQRWMQNQKMNLPQGNDTPVLPIQIQYRLSPDPDIPGDLGIYHHIDSSCAFIVKKGRDQNIFQTAAYQRYGSRKDSVLNIFFHEHHPDSVASATYKASVDGVGFQDHVKVFGALNNTSNRSAILRGEDIHSWYLVANLLNHEVGHTLGLGHTWAGSDGCDDTPENPNCWDQGSGPDCAELLSNNMMDYNNCQCAVTPCQIGKMHYTLWNGRKQPPFRDPVWCTFDNAFTIIISGRRKVDWHSPRRLQGDLILQAGTRLTLHCELGMPPNGRIVLKPGAELWIKPDAFIHQPCQKTWFGVELQQSEKQKAMVRWIDG